MRAACRQGTHPDALHVERDAVRGDALVVRGLEDVVFPALVDKALPELLHLRLELVCGEDLVRQGGEGQVEVVRELAIFELRGLGEALPDLLHVSGEGCLEVGEGSGADVVSDDEEQKCARVASIFSLSITSVCWPEVTCPSAVFFPNNPRLTSNTVFSRPMFAPWYNPTWCSHKLTMSTSEDANENNADLRSKSLRRPCVQGKIRSA